MGRSSRDGSFITHDRPAPVKRPWRGGSRPGRVKPIPAGSRVMARKKAQPPPNLPADQPFSGLEPGSLLHDFEVLLRAIEPGMPVSDKNGMPGGQTIPQLDAKLHRPLSLQL